MTSCRTKRQTHTPANRATACAVALSLTTGLVAAALLTFVVFPGAAEPVITGSGLLGCSAGWALLVWLTSRTGQPQDWAGVPAVLMSVTGALLIATTPGGDVLSAAGWVWPPVVAVVAIYCLIRMRRQLHRQARWLLYPVLGAVVVTSAGGMSLKVASLDDLDDAPSAQMFEIDGRLLHLACTGTGSPTVVAQGGLGEMAGWWARVTPAVAETTRVCVFERAGQGWSEDSSASHDGRHAAQDLHAVLSAADETGPFVLVGHSTGGAYALTYADQYPEDVAGVALLDSSSPDQFSLVPTMTTEFAVTRRVVALAPTLSRTGLATMLPASFFSDLPRPAAEQVRAMAATPQGWRNYRDEQAATPALFRQAQALTSLGDKPLVVLTALENASEGWGVAQGQLTLLSTNSSRRFAEVDHAGVLDDAAGARMSVRAIEDVVSAVREGFSLRGGGPLEGEHAN